MKNSRFAVVTGRLVVCAAALSAVVAVLPLGAPWSLVAVNGALVVLATIDWFRTPKPSTVKVSRALPGMLTLESDGEVRWRVDNPVDRRIHVAVADELPPSFRARNRRFRVTVPRRGRALARTTIRPVRRGRFTVSEVVVRVDGPWRLVARQGRRRIPATMRVYPPFKSKQEAELRIEKARILDVGLRSVRGHGGGTEFEQLREYSVDDDFRRIDWAATARAQKPIVRTYRAERNQNVVLLLDSGRVMAGLVAGVPRLEHAMDAVMTVTTVAGRLGDRVGLVAFDRGVRAEVPAAHGARQLTRVTEAMYELEPELVESDYRGAFVHTMSRFRRRSLVVVLTELAEQGITETLMPALPLIARNHVVLVASVSDPQVSEWAGAVPVEAGKAFRKAAATSALEDRRRTTALLQARGATVVDAAPGKLSADLADAYLRVKARGRL